MIKPDKLKVGHAVEPRAIAASDDVFYIATSCGKASITVNMKSTCTIHGSLPPVVVGGFDEGDFGLRGLSREHGHCIEESNHRCSS